MYRSLVMKLVKDNIVKITDDPVKIEKLIELGYELTGVEIVEEREDNKAEDKEVEDNKAEDKEADEVVNEETEAIETAEAAEEAEKAEVKKTKKTTSNKK